MARSDVIKVHVADMPQVQALVKALETERDRLHRVVARYGGHTEDCPAYDDGDLSPDCECGWNHACVRSFEFAGQEQLDQEEETP